MTQTGGKSDQSRKSNLHYIPFGVIWLDRKGAVRMDFMIGSVDTKRLRRDLLRQLRCIPNQKSPEVRNKIYTARLTDEQGLLAMAKKEDMEIRRYIR